MTVASEAPTPAAPEAAETITLPYDTADHAARALMDIEEMAGAGVHTVERLRAELREAFGFKPHEPTRLPPAIRDALDELEDALRCIASEADYPATLLCRALP